MVLLTAQLLVFSPLKPAEKKGGNIRGGIIIISFQKNGRWDDGRWTLRMLNWEPLSGRRGVGRPEARWEDCLVRFARDTGTNWRDLAKNRENWCSLEDKFVQQGA